MFNDMKKWQTELPPGYKKIALANGSFAYVSESHLFPFDEDDKEGKETACYGANSMYYADNYPG